VTTFAHKIASIICEHQASQEENGEDSLSLFSANDLFNIVYGFGQL